MYVSVFPKLPHRTFCDIGQYTMDLTRNYTVTLKSASRKTCVSSLSRPTYCDRQMSEQITENKSKVWHDQDESVFQYQVSKSG